MEAFFYAQKGVQHHEHYQLHRVLPPAAAVSAGWKAFWLMAWVALLAWRLAAVKYGWSQWPS